MNENPDYAQETRDLLRMLPRCLEPGLVIHTDKWQCMAFPYRGRNGLMAFDGSVLEDHPLYFEQVKRIVLDPASLPELQQKSRRMAQAVGLDVSTTPVVFRDALARFYLRPEQVEDFVGALRDAVNLLWYSQIAEAAKKPEPVTLPWG